MGTLKENWLTDGLIDYEYKKYVLLAYLKDARESFQRVELYPFLSDLILHYRNLAAIQENKMLMTDKFPKELSLENLASLQLTYRTIMEDDAVMREIESIIDFSLPQLKSSVDEGAMVYEYVASQCEISSIGLTSLYEKEGYLFISQPPEKETQVYRYQITIFDNSNEVLRGIHTQYLLNAERTLANSYEALKLRLMREFSDLPNPATYLVHSKVKVPLTNTLMPVAKRLLAKQFSPIF